MDLVEQIMAFEQGELEQDEVIDLFCILIKTGDVWTLQGSYGRAARNFIEAGFISPEGERLATREEP